jgi:hypothetical protein
MPPPKSKQPDETDKAKLLAWIASFAPSEIDCTPEGRARALGRLRTGVMSRRLNRTEYNNTMRDLVGVDIHPADGFPSDGSGGEGFDNNGDALFVSPLLMEKYLAAADRVLDAAFADAAARDRLVIAKAAKDLPARYAAKRVLEKFATRAFRRPVEDAELERFLSLFDRAAARGESFDLAIRLPLKSILISSHFLFLVETEPEKHGVYRVNDFVLAARLSYFLWSSTPDDELSSLAARGTLHDPQVLGGQVRRMLKDPKSRALAENFAIQWLALDGLGVSVRPDRRRFPDYDEDLARSMKQEAILFFDSVFREDRSLLELIDSDYTFANERLAKLYGIDGVKGPELRRVALPSDHSRGGVLGMAAVLTATSFPLRTSPVLRGKWVMESLLGGKVPPPPPTAGTLPTDDKKVNGLTFRQKLEKHRSKPECAGCHQKMDPLGFGLENFDPIGRWREKVSDEPVDASGVLPGGEKFSGPQQLRQVLLKRKPEFLRTLTRKLLGYALGRGLGAIDQCTIQDATTALDRSDYKPSVLVEQIVLSDSFQYRNAGR